MRRTILRIFATWFPSLAPLLFFQCITREKRRLRSLFPAGHQSMVFSLLRALLHIRAIVIARKIHSFRNKNASLTPLAFFAVSLTKSAVFVRCPCGASKKRGAPIKRLHMRRTILRIFAIWFPSLVPLRKMLAHFQGIACKKRGFCALRD